MIEMTVEATAQILENLIAHGAFNAMTRNAIENAVRLLKKPGTIRCKDCKHFQSDFDDNEPDKGFCYGACSSLHAVHEEWYCADGER